MMCSCFLGWGGLLALPQTTSASVGEGQDKLCPCFEHTDLTVDASLVARPSGEVACLGLDSLQVMKLTEGVRLLHDTGRGVRKLVSVAAVSSVRDPDFAPLHRRDESTSGQFNLVGGLAFLSAAVSRNGLDVSLFRTVSPQSTR